MLVNEPDFFGDPFHDLREDVTCTLAILMAQLAVVNRLDVKPVEVRFDDKMVLVTGCLGERRVYLQRLEPRPGDSGWYVGPVDGPAPEDNPDSYEVMYVFQLLRTRPFLLQLLALPPDYLAILDGDEIGAVVDPGNNDVWNTGA